MHNRQKIAIQVKLSTSNKWICTFLLLACLYISLRCLQYSTMYITITATAKGAMQQNTIASTSNVCNISSVAASTGTLDTYRKNAANTNSIAEIHSAILRTIAKCFVL